MNATYLYHRTRLAKRYKLESMLPDRKFYQSRLQTVLAVLALTFLIAALCLAGWSDAQSLG